jgi:nucleoside 2-deoxyribosyltransferase
VIYLKIYLSGAIQGGRDLQKVYEVMVELLNKMNFEVLTLFVASKNILEEESLSDNKAIFLKDIECLNEADCIIAEVSIPSLGVGYEIAHALDRKIPVLALYDGKYAPISAMITGNNSSYLSVKEYSSIPQLHNRIAVFLERMHIHC